MINTRKTIFQTLKKRIRELTKHAQLAPQEFKKIMLAVILNDMKEWSEYIPKDNPKMIVNLLENYLMNNCFIIDRMQNENSLAYVNVNTPQTNNTWARVWDRQSSDIYQPEEIAKSKEEYKWVEDPTCETKIVYFYPVNDDQEPMKPVDYLKKVYGEFGQNLKTVCEKMNVFIDRTTGEGWYLDTNCDWKQIGSNVDGMTEEEVRELLSNYKINRVWNTSVNQPNIELQLVEGGDQNKIELLTTEDLEDII